MATDAGAAVAASAAVVASAPSSARTASAQASTPAPSAAASPAPGPAAETLWAEASDLLDGLDAPEDDPIELRIPLSSDEHARLRDRAEAQGVSLEEALRRLI